MRRLRYALEALAFVLALTILRLFPPEVASNIGGFLGRAVGPRLAASARARRNLRLVMPELSEQRIAEIVRGMWDNLGRTFAEYPHLARITDPASGRVELAGVEAVYRLRDEGGPGILCSAHMGNWEILPIMAARHGLDLMTVVREPNNPYVRTAIERMRGVAGGRRTNKGAAAALDAVRALRSGGVLGVLVDQKLNNGIAVPFFGIEAMTAPTPAQLAQRFQCPVIMGRIERTGPARFRVTAREPLDLPDTGDRQQDVLLLARRMNDILEEWIRARPEQWFWLHRRWPDDAYRRAGL